MFRVSDVRARLAHVTFTLQCAVQPPSTGNPRGDIIPGFELDIHVALSLGIQRLTLLISAPTCTGGVIRGNAVWLPKPCARAMAVMVSSGGAIG
jgi:hypothetical protein